MADVMLGGCVRWDHYPHLMTNVAQRAYRTLFFEKKASFSGSAEHADAVVLNRCPRCTALCRTPRARLCPECHHAWHEVG